MISRSIISGAVLAALASAPAVAQLVIYPAKGQSAAQQQKDETMSCIRQEADGL